MAKSKRNGVKRVHGLYEFVIQVQFTNGDLVEEHGKTDLTANLIMHSDLILEDVLERQQQTKHEFLKSSYAKPTLIEKDCALVDYYTNDNQSICKISIKTQLIENAQTASVV